MTFQTRAASRDRPRINFFVHVPSNEHSGAKTFRVISLEFSVLGSEAIERLHVAQLIR